MKHKIFFGSFPNHAAKHGHQVSHKLVEFVEYVLFSSFICLSICSTVVLWGTTFCSFVYLHIWEKDNRPHLKWKEKFHIHFSSKLFTHIYDNVISKEQLCIQLEKYKCLRFILILFHFCYMFFILLFFNKIYLSKFQNQRLQLYEFQKTAAGVYWIRRNTTVRQAQRTWCLPKPHHELRTVGSWL